MDKFSIFGSKRDRAYGWEKGKFWFDLSIFWSSTGSCKEKEVNKSRYEAFVWNSCMETIINLSLSMFGLGKP